MARIEWKRVLLAVATIPWALTACGPGTTEGPGPEETPLATATAAVTVNATYHATLKVPACTTLASGCDTGTLVNGRASLGPESNAPNALGTCPDGTSGTYHSDESLDRVRVFTTDGANFAPGKTVTIEATVWAYSSYTSDKLDLYYAANASSPSWTFLTTLTPSGSGVQTLRANYTLPSGGSMQAVRGVFRYGGSASPCGSGSYDDRDDVAFAVGTGAPADTTPPTASLLSPADGATVSEVVSVQANASDTVGVTKVEFYVDSALFTVAYNTAPNFYEAAWTTTQGVTNGPHTLHARAYDAAGNVRATATRTVTVNNPGIAAYDAAMRVPRCATVGARCDSGTFTSGRATANIPELNHPNTLQGACTDGGSTSVWTSVNRVKVYTNDGTELAPGKSVTVEVYVIPDSSLTQTLDIFSAADVTQPVWTHVASRTPVPNTGQTLTATFTLPNGHATQAIRASLRSGTTVSPCPLGSSDDRDDLAFAVAGENVPPTTALTSPASGATVAGLVTLTADASDNVGVTKVEFYRGLQLLGTDTTAPYALSWNTSAEPNGTYSLTTRAYDLRGNVGTSAPVSVTVNSPELLTNGGFEGSVAPWTLSGPAYYSSGDGQAHSGSGHIYLRPGSYSGPTAYARQTLTIPASGAVLGYWLSIATTSSSSGGDTLNVAVRGATNTHYFSYSNAYAGSVTNYQYYSADISTFAGQTVDIEISAYTSSFGTTYFRLDDLSVRAKAAP